MDRRAPRPVQRHAAVPASGRVAQRILPVACSSHQREGASERGPGRGSRGHPSQASWRVWPRAYAAAIANSRPLGERAASATQLAAPGLGPVYRHARRVTTDSEHSRPVASNLLERRFNGRQPDRALGVAGTSRLSGPGKAGCLSQRYSIWRAGAS